MWTAVKKTYQRTFHFSCCIHREDHKTRVWLCVKRWCSSWGLCSDKRCLFYIRSRWRISKLVLSPNFIWLSLFQTTCSTAQKASPPRFSASTCRPWKGTRPTFSEQSFELWGCQTQVPRGMNSGLSSTRCVKVPFPCPSIKIKGKAHSRDNKELQSLPLNVIFVTR